MCYRQGWECPRCKRINSPDRSECICHYQPYRFVYPFTTIETIPTPNPTIYQNEYDYQYPTTIWGTWTVTSE